ncbi:single-stranded DNA-binding protein [bacterium]|nr:single-stranded DNA-binding protein [bacterium]
MSAPENTVRLVGKISRLSPVKYTPSGVAVREATLAVPQSSLGKTSVGYHEVFFAGDLAELHTQKFRIGSRVDVTGTLWSREFRNRRGDKVNETKVIVSEAALLPAKGSA